MIISSLVTSLATRSYIWMCTFWFHVVLLFLLVPHDRCNLTLCHSLDIRFFYLGFTAGQDYFTHFEPRQSLGGAKMGGPPRKNNLTTCKQNLTLSHKCPKLGSNPQWWDEEQSRALKISGLNHSATGAAGIRRRSFDSLCFLPNLHISFWLYASSIPYFAYRSCCKAITCRQSDKQTTAPQISW